MISHDQVLTLVLLKFASRSLPAPRATAFGVGADASEAGGKWSWCCEPNNWYRNTLTRLPPDCDPGVGTSPRDAGEGLQDAPPQTLSCTAGEGGPSAGLGG